MHLRTIESKHNPRLKELRRAFSAGHRGALAAIEGPNLIEEALRAGLCLRTLFLAQEFAAYLDRLPLQAATEVFLAPRAVLAPFLATESPQPVAALVEPPSWRWSDLLSGPRPPLLLLLAGLQDPGNLGTILRSAEAFGASGLVALPGTVSLWNPKAVRASAGSLFRLPLLSASPEEAFAALRKAGVRIWTTALREATPAFEARLDEPAAILIGNEGNGVPEEIARAADAALTLPCPGPVESLNAAVAASLLLYEASRQRATAAKEAGSR